MKHLPIILASASPRRAELLRAMGFTFKIETGEATELHDDQLTAAEVSRLNAFRKARVVAERHPDSLVIGADTLVYLDEKLFGKPADLADARKMLKRLQGRTHHVVTGVCLMHLQSHRRRVFAEMTSVKFRPLSSAEINAYLSATNPLDKAGAYAIQEHGDKIVEEISGSYNNVVGLPTERLGVEIAAFSHPPGKDVRSKVMSPKRLARALHF